MKISEIHIKNFKRFTDLKITNIPSNVKVIIVIGPNGSGKSSLFDAMHIWYRNIMEPFYSKDDLYYPKSSLLSFEYEKNVQIKFHDFGFKVKPNAFLSIDEKREQIKGKFYFRTAYRNEADFTISSLTKMDDPTSNIKIKKLIQNDETVGENYQRLISLTLKGVYDSENDSIEVKELRENLIGKIRQSLLNVFEDLTLSSIGDPLKDGTFYFEKGTAKNYHFKNLSGGEKAGFDIILDLIIKSSYFKDTVYCIDEPETHMHTQLQASLFEEIFRLIPSESQLWINTHSIGILRKAREIAKQSGGQVAFLSFDNLDFDMPVEISPVEIDKKLWERSIQLALDDFSELVAPKTIILCEGDVFGRKNKSFDSEVYNRIFSNKYFDTLFVSIGSANDLENDNNITYQLLKGILKSTNVVRLIDGDDKNDQEILEFRERGIKVLSLRHIESYLWDNEILEKICILYNKSEKLQELIQVKEEKIEISIKRGNSKDDIKSASSEIYDVIKRLFGLTKSGSTKEAFLRDTVSSLMTSDTKIFKLLEKDIFG